MSSWKNSLILTLAAALLVGCLPKKRIVWSPDGRMAAVVTDNDLRFIDGEGAVLPLRLAGAVKQCAWFPDAGRIVAAFSTKAKTWSEAEKLLSNAQTARISAFAREVRPRIMAYQGDWDDFKLSPQDKHSGSMELAAMIYLRDRLSEGLPKKLGEKWKDLEDLEMDITRLGVFTIEHSTLSPGRILAASIDEINTPRVAPGGKLVSFLTGRWEGSDDDAALYVVPTGSGPSKLIANHVALDYDWSPDGRSLAFIRATSAKPEDDADARIGQLTTATVAAADGTLFEEPSPVKDRVGLFFSEIMGVRWLKDGRLLFSSVELCLPVTTGDMPQQWSLFVLDPRMSASVTRVLARDFIQSMEDSLPLFELSPDERRVLLPQSNGHIAIYEFATGESTRLVKKQDDAEDKIRSLPCWRNNDEVCFVVPRRSKGNTKIPAKVVIWRDGNQRSLSKDWPDDMKNGWLVGD